jgi:cell division protein FtsQ
MLISRDGIVFSGTGFDPAMVQTLPWIDGVNLKRTGGSFEPVDGMREVSDLLSCAKFEAEGLYRNWQVVNLSKLGSDDEIEVRTRDGMRVTFGTKEGYLRQVARLDLLVGESTDPTRPIREVNLALGSQVPVAYGTAAPSLEGPPVNAAGPAASRAMIAFPSFTTSSQDTTHREL